MITPVHHIVVSSTETPWISSDIRVLKSTIVVSMCSHKISQTFGCTLVLPIGIWQHLLSMFVDRGVKGLMECLGGTTASGP
jgi:hypothetical protein